ncbi:hypothetical protein C4571_02835 [Candidatus Parcubacteria bacterium]|nr:MAG: hypothetical protein C4571_02835 [Candidatus Parcubacteria bacterium]
MEQFSEKEAKNAELQIVIDSLLETIRGYRDFFSAHPPLQKRWEALEKEAETASDKKTVKDNLVGFLNYVAAFKGESESPREQRQSSTSR